MTDVFISYKREERERCSRIAEKLRALGLDVWFDAKLESGTSFDAEIEEKVNTAKSVLVLWSPLSVKSTWVRNEATIGQKRNVLVAAEIAPCTYPIAFTNTQTATLHDANFRDDDPAWLSVLGRVAKLSARPHLSFYVSALDAADRTKPKVSAAPIIAAAVAGLALGGLVGFVVRGAGPTPAIAATAAGGPADLVGVWGGGDFPCASLPVSLSLEAKGFTVGIGQNAPSYEKIDPDMTGWWKSAGQGAPNFWKREGDDLLWRAGDVSDAANEVRLTKCAV
jgi:hypothetical protein